MPFTRFMDMHSGGGAKEGPFEYIYIEAPEAEARVIFYNRFGHNPDRVSCTCCGEDYSVTECADLAQATAFDRGCAFEDGMYVERQHKAYRKYKTLEQYLTDPTILIIKADEIKPEERVGSVPKQGYVWQD